MPVKSDATALVTGTRTTTMTVVTWVNMTTVIGGSGEMKMPRKVFRIVMKVMTGIEEVASADSLDEGEVVETGAAVVAIAIAIGATIKDVIEMKAERLMKGMKILDMNEGWLTYIW